VNINNYNNIIISTSQAQTHYHCSLFGAAGLIVLLDLIVLIIVVRINIIFRGSEHTPVESSHQRHHYSLQTRGKHIFGDRMVHKMAMQKCCVCVCPNRAKITLLIVHQPFKYNHYQTY